MLHRLRKYQCHSILPPWGYCDDNSKTCLFTGCHFWDLVPSGDQITTIISCTEGASNHTFTGCYLDTGRVDLRNLNQTFISPKIVWGGDSTASTEVFRFLATQANQDFVGFTYIPACGSGVNLTNVNLFSFAFAGGSWSLSAAIRATIESYNCKTTLMGNDNSSSGTAGERMIGGSKDVKDLQQLTFVAVNQSVVTNNSIFYNEATGRMCIKDNTGTVRTIAYE